MPERPVFRLRRKRQRKIPVKLQMNQYDCGPSCLHMLLAYHGYEADFTDLRERFAMLGNGRDGSSMLKMKEVAQTYHLKGIAKKAPVESLNNDFLPVICFWEDNHFVVLERIKTSGHFIIVDPALGRLVISTQEFAEKYSGIFLLVYPDEGFVPLSEKKISKVAYFKDLIRSNKKYFGWTVLLALGLQLVSVAFPFLMQVSIDAATSGEGYSLFPVLITSIVLLTLFQIGFSYMKDMCIVRLQELLDSQLTTNFVSHMLKLPYQYFEIRSRGDLMLRINSNTTIREILSQKMISTLINLFLIVVTFTYIVIQSRLIAFTLLGVGLVQILVFVYTRSRFKKLTQTQIVAQSLAGSFMTEVLEGISTIKSLGIEERTGEKWRALFMRQLATVKEKAIFQTRVNTVTNTLSFMTPMLILLVGLYQIMQGNMTLGMLVSFQSLAALFLGPLNSLALMLNEFVMADALLDRIYDVIQAEESNKFKKKTPTLRDVKLNGDITIDQVSFRYTDYGEDVLKNINITIKAGQRVALVGKSGSGKSTLAKLLVGLYTPTQGNIYFDGVVVEELEQQDIRSQISIVLQDNFVFNNTVYDNIRLHAEGSTLEDVMFAAKLADIHDDIEKMPMKYNTLISEAGSNLSGGQKQRVALARALVSRPKVLLLDEATSALDTVTEATIAHNLNMLKCTQIIIAHRLSTIRSADTIYVLDQGVLVDAGTHDELIGRCKSYNDLVCEQLDETGARQYG
ncbi:peptidase domain-containing ABC transporter [Paenibacillus sp. FSL K6-1122]|nr:MULTISPECIES: peptidase domain-containing ABC transporter [unclassified Paenibacillus]ETT32423.1 lantibiotic mersacidin transporter system [Paenibacillus sp. FSL R5-192]ETT42298.1 lantibiotic mersacidin transporter system [Paenibacillus sp. FSL H7-689]